MSVLRLNVLQNLPVFQNFLEKIFSPFFKPLLHFRLNSMEPFCLRYSPPFFLCFQNYLSDLANIIKNFREEEFVVECVGVLGNLNIPELEYSMLLKEYDLLNYIKSKIYPGNIKQVFLKYSLNSHLKTSPLARLLTLSVSRSIDYIDHQEKHVYPPGIPYFILFLYFHRCFNIF